MRKSLTSIFLLIGFVFFYWPADSTLASSKRQVELPTRMVEVTDTARSNKISPDLQRNYQQKPAGTQRIIVYLKAQADLDRLAAKGLGGESRTDTRRGVVRALMQTALSTQSAALALLPASASGAKAKPAHSYWIFNGFAAAADYTTVMRLAASPDVAYIYADEIIELPPDETDDSGGENATPTATAEPEPPGLEWGLKKMNVDRVWNELGVDGAGVVVATIDSGVMWDHPALKEKYRGWDGSQADHQYSWFDALTGRTSPYDDQGHGTHTMGSLVGGSSEGGSIGVAPGAKWISVKALDSHGSGMASDLLKAMEWILAPGGDADMAPDVVSNSWGARTCEDTFHAAVKAWQAAGIVGVFSNGNSGQGGESSVGAPACYPEALGVGATDPEDHVADFSSRGPSPLEVVKPNVCAPGVRIRSSLNNGQYGEKSGTSMSTPYTAGVVALILSANARLSGSEVDALLEKSAVDLGEPGEDNASGWGRIDAYLAVQAAEGVDATPTPASRITPIPSATGLPMFTATATEEYTPRPGDSPTETSTPAPTAVFDPFPTRFIESPTIQPERTALPLPMPAITEIPNPSSTPIDGSTPPVQGIPQRNFSVLFDDADITIHYDAGWGEEKDGQTWGGSQHVSTRNGATFDIDFYGDRFSLVNSRTPSSGILQLTVDGVFAGYVNLYAPQDEWRQRWTSMPLSLAEHRLKVTHYNGASVNIDAIIVYRKESSEQVMPAQVRRP